MWTSRIRFGSRSLMEDHPRRVSWPLEDSISTIFRYVVLVCLVCIPAGYSHRRRDWTVLGGRETNITQHPYQVAIVIDDKYFCSGVIISSDFVLSAGRCFNTPSKTTVRAGTSYHSSGGTVHNVTKIVKHEVFDEVDPLSDIAVLHVSPPFTFSESVQPVLLPEEDEETIYGANAMATGWGETNMTEGKESVLYETHLAILSYRQCRRDIVPLRKIICAVIPNAESSICRGDYGGPLVVGKKLVGMVSYSKLNCPLKNEPSEYIAISSLRVWIYKHAKV